MNFEGWVWEDEEFEDITTRISEKAAELVIKEIRDDCMITIDKTDDKWQFSFSALGGELVINHPFDEEVSTWSNSDYADDIERLELATMLRQAADRIERGGEEWLGITNTKA